LSVEKGRQLSEESLNEVRKKHIEPHGTVYEVTTKRERVRHSGSKSWGWSYVQRPLMNHPGLAAAVLDFLNQAR
jgi:hypothetical protein